MDAIHLANVTKTFEGHVAVNDLSLTVPEGSVYGFIGPNGSGKSTTLRMIMHIILPDRGEIVVRGERGTRAAHDQIGYLPEERGLYKKMKIRRLLRYFARLKGFDPPDLDRKIEGWLDTLGLAKWADHKIDALSKGMAQKIQFIGTVISEPKLLILDEPFSGLDPVNMEAMRDAIIEMRRRGTTVVFSTHDMAMAEKMCDRIFMIFKGNKVLDGTLDDIQARYGLDTVRIRAALDGTALTGFPGVESVNDYGQLQEVRLTSDPQQFLQRLIAAGQVHHFEVTRPSLHDIFVRIARPQPEEVR